MNKEVKSSIRKIKREALDKKVKKLEDEYQKWYHDSRNVFKMVKELEDNPRKALSILKDSNGIKHTDSEAVLGLWKEHFERHLNTAFHHEESAIDTLSDHPQNFSQTLLNGR